MSGELALWLAAGPLVAYALFVLISTQSRYRVVWVRLSIGRRAVTRRGALRESARLRRAHGDEFRVWDRWRGRWLS